MKVSRLSSNSVIIKSSKSVDISVYEDTKSTIIKTKDDVYDNHKIDRSIV